MDDSTLLVLGGALGLTGCLLGVVLTYWRHHQLHISIVEDAERELLDEIQRIGVAELEQTEAGSTLLRLRAETRDLVFASPLEARKILFGPLDDKSKLRPLSKTDLFLKRTLDCTFSICSLFLLAPALLLVAILIRLDSPGPVLYRKPVVGINGKRFDVFHFRTTHVRLPEQDDLRITRIGRILLRSNIDYLPELFSVLKGDMSLVGPRTIPQRMIAEQPGRYVALPIRSGITGSVQVSGLERMTYEERIRLDVHYIRTWTIWSDLRMILLSPYAAMGGKFDVTKIDRPKPVDQLPAYPYGLWAEAGA